MDDQEKLLQTPPPPDSTEDESVAIPVNIRDNVTGAIRHAAQEARQSRLAIELDEAEEQSNRPKFKTDNLKFSLPPQHRRKARPNPEAVSEDERIWAALAHGSTLLTIVAAISTAGISSLITIFIPLAIYLYYRNRSEFVAHHALQAFAAQVVGVIGFLVLVTALVAVWAVLLVVSALLIILLIGIPLLILVLLAGMIAVPLTLVLPFGTLVYSMIAAVEAWHGHHYSYPWIGDWVDEQIYGKL